MVNTELEIGRAYSFETLAPEYLGAKFTDCSFVAKVNAETAINLFKKPVDVMHIAVFSDLPPGTNSNFRALTYYVFSKNGEIMVFAKDWINQNTLKVSESVRTVFTFESLSPEDLAALKETLGLMGIRNYSVS